MAPVSSNHWRRLTTTIVALMAMAFVAPRLIQAPGIQENRVLAAKPAWPARPQDFRAFRKAADAYVADHFPIRPHLIGLLNFIRLQAGVSGSGRVLIGRDGWLFYDDDSHLGTARNDPPLDLAHARGWLAVLAGRTEALKAQGVAYLVVAPPVKEVIYPEKAPAWFTGPAPNRMALTVPYLAHASRAGEVLYLGPQVAVATASGQKTYSLHDTHWSGYGAYAGYVGLMQKLEAMGVTGEDPRPLASFPVIELHGIRRPRDLALMLGVSSFVKIDYPNLGNPEAMRKLRTTYLSRRKDWTSPQVVDTGEAGKPVLVMIRDSFSNELLPFLYPHFSRIVLVHIQDGFWRPDLVEPFHPNAVILEVLEPGLRMAVGDGPRLSPEAYDRINATLALEASILKTGKPVGKPALAPDPGLAAALDKSEPAPGCNLEAVTLMTDGDGERALKVSGWISELGPTITAPVGEVRLKGPAGDAVGQVRVDLPRPDVAAFFKTPTGAKSGFSATLQLGKLPKGDYRPMAYRRSVDGWIVCNGPQTLSVP